MCVLVCALWRMSDLGEVRNRTVDKQGTNERRQVGICVSSSFSSSSFLKVLRVITRRQASK